MFLQQLITGLSVGSIYALMAVGYSLITVYLTLPTLLTELRC